MEWVDSTPPELRVRLRIPAAVLADLPPEAALRMEFPESPFMNRDGGYGGFVQVRGEDFSPTPIDRERGVDLSYEVVLEHHLAGPSYGLDDVPHPAGSGWMVVGRAFLPSIRWGERQVTIPLQLSLSGLWGPRPLSEPVPLDALQDRLYLHGPVRTHALSWPETELTLATLTRPPVLEPLGELLGELYGALAPTLGPLPHSQVLVVVDAVDRSMEGGVIGSDISLLLAPPASGQLDPSARKLVTHEFIHLWNGRGPAWQREGLTEYLRLRTGAAVWDRSMSLPEAISGQHAQHGVATDRPLAEEFGPAAYPGGAVVGYCLDVMLEAEGRSLDEVLGESLETGTDLPELLAGEPIGERLQAWLNTPPPLPLADCFEADGGHAEGVPYTELSMRTVALSILKSTSFSSQSGELYTVEPGSPFQPGDVLVEMAGEKLSGIGDIAWALRGVAIGELVPVVVRRGVERVSLSFEMPALDPDEGRRAERVLWRP